MKDELRGGRGTSQVVHLYWTTDKPQERNFLIVTDAIQNNEGKQKKTKQAHLPGDSLLPSVLWPPGKIIDDSQLMRIKFGGGNPVTFRATLRDLGKAPANDWPGEILTPIESDLPVDGDGRVILGTVPYGSKDLPKLGDALKAFNEARVVNLAKKQPY
jgi:hypothetical protein